MSHTVDMGLRVMNIEALRRACVTLGVELVKKRTFKKWGSEGSCEFAICVPGNSHAYEAGVVKRDGGGYSILADEWQGGHGLIDKIGKHADRLNQEYVVETAIEDRQNQGYQVTREEQEDGHVFLRCHR